VHRWRLLAPAPCTLQVARICQQLALGMYIFIFHHAAEVRTAVASSGVQSAQAQLAAISSTSCWFPLHSSIAFW
jgi:hypothetical protein